MNGIEINIKKTKVMIFSKGSTSYFNQHRTFNIGKDKLEVVKSYTYLGIPFFQNANFKRSSMALISKAKRALFALWSVLQKSGISSLKVACQLFDSKIFPILSYASHIWGIQYGRELEQLHLMFIKKLFSLPLNTANYFVRL